MTGQGWHALWHRRASPSLFHFDSISHSASVCHRLPRFREREKKEINKGIIDAFLKFFCVCLCEPRIKREHLNFNVSKVQNCMLCNCIKTGLHDSQPSVLKSLTPPTMCVHPPTHTHTFMLLTFTVLLVCVCPPVIA